MSWPSYQLQMLALSFVTIFSPTFGAHLKLIVCEVRLEVSQGAALRAFNIYINVPYYSFVVC